MGFGFGLWALFLLSASLLFTGQRVANQRSLSGRGVRVLGFRVEVWKFRVSGFWRLKFGS